MSVDLAQLEEIARNANKQEGGDPNERVRDRDDDGNEVVDDDDDVQMFDKKTKKRRTFPALKIDIPKVVAKRKKLDDEDMTIAQKQVAEVLNETFNEGANKPFEVGKYAIDEDQKSELHRKAIQMPEFWQIDSKHEAPLNAAKGQFRAAQHDRLLFNVQNELKDLERLGIGLMLNIVEKKEKEALEGAVELLGGLFSVDSEIGAERSRLTQVLKSDARARPKSYFGGVGRGSGMISNYDQAEPNQNYRGKNVWRGKK